MGGLTITVEEACQLTIQVIGQYCTTASNRAIPWLGSHGRRVAYTNELHVWGVLSVPSLFLIFSFHFPVCLRCKLETFCGEDTKGRRHAGGPSEDPYERLFPARKQRAVPVHVRGRHFLSITSHGTMAEIVASGTEVELLSVAC